MSTKRALLFLACLCFLFSFIGVSQFNLIALGLTLWTASQLI
jgi:hypothetical protein